MARHRRSSATAPTPGATLVIAVRITTRTPVGELSAGQQGTAIRMASVATSARCRRNNVGLVGRTCCGPSAMLSRTGQRAGARVNRRGEHARSGVPGSPTGPRIRRVRRTLCGYTLGTPARRRATAMYLVAAGDQREALTLPRPGPHRPTAPQTQPVGVRHAVAVAFAGSRQPTALCGADIHGWFVFSAVTFDTSHAAACQRCAQLVDATSATKHIQRDALRSIGWLG